MVPGSARNWIIGNAVNNPTSPKEKTKYMTTLHLKNSINCSPLRRAFLLVPLALALFALVPAIRAVSPPPDGGYPGQNTAEGDGALSVLTTGVSNTALGFHALNINGTG